MNNKLSLPELSNLVANITGYSPKACELFLHELFAVVSETILAGENVKIKGLGTFKVTSVEERKSVNVNTGEQMLIPSHRKVTFAPEKAVAEAVNAPFSMFEPVELSDDVSDETLDASFELDKPKKIHTSQTETEDNTRENAPVKDSAEIENAELHTTSASTVCPVAEEPIVSDRTTDTLTEDENINSPTTSTIENKPDSSIDFANNDEEKTEADNTEVATQAQGEESSPSIMTDDTQTSTPIIYDEEEDQEDYYDYLDRKRNRSHFGKGVLVGALCAIIMLGIIFLSWKIFLPESFNRVTTSISGIASQDNTQSSNIASGDLPQSNTQIAQPSTPVKTSVTPPDTLLTDTISSIKPTTKQEDIDVPTPTSDNQNNPEPQVFTDKITKHRYLTTMAREYYGNFNLWPLIYDYNKGLGHPDRIRPGTVIKVPSAETLGIDPKDKDVIKKAKKRGTQIYNKYR